MPEGLGRESPAPVKPPQPLQDGDRRIERCNPRQAIVEGHWAGPQASAHDIETEPLPPIGERKKFAAVRRQRYRREVREAVEIKGIAAGAGRRRLRRHDRRVEIGAPQDAGGESVARGILGESAAPSGR